MKSITLFCFAFFFLFVSSGYCQLSTEGTLHKKGIIIYNDKCCKYFAILMQDTTLSGNRFDNWFELPVEGNHTVNPKNIIQLPAFIIDSTLFLRCEARLQKGDSSITFYDYSKENLKSNLTKYIRLYIGYIDTSSQLNVVVQFLTKKEYKKNERMYSKELSLLALQRNLRFAILKFKKEDL